MKQEMNEIYRSNAGTSETEQEGAVPHISIELQLSNDMLMLERKRYNIWDLMGDIGGLHDGIYLFI